MLFEIVAAADTETPLVCAEEPLPRLVCMSLSDDSGDYLFHHSDPTVPIVLAESIERAYEADGNGGVAFANAPYDLLVLSTHAPDLAPLVWQAYADGKFVDVQLTSMLRDLAAGIGLNRMYRLEKEAERHLNIELDKNEWRLRYEELIDVPLERWSAGARAYPLDDSGSTLALARLLSRPVDNAEIDAGIVADLPRQMRGHWALHLAGTRGIHVDQAQVDYMFGELEREFQAHKATLVSAGLLRPNGVRNMEAVRRYVENSGVTEVTKSGKVSTKASTLISIDDPVLRAYSRFTSILGLKSRTLAPLREAGDLAIHTRFSPLKENGRTGSSEPNLQNLPRVKGYRECLVPRPGYKLLIGDHKTMELGTWGECLAEMFGNFLMVNAINSGVDPHMQLGLRLNPEQPDRQLGKIGNFGFPGMLSPGAFVEYCKKFDVWITYDQAAYVQHHWYAEWQPGAYFDYVKTEAVDGIVQLYSGRVRSGGRVTDYANGFFSGLAADIHKDVLWRLACEQHGFEFAVPSPHGRYSTPPSDVLRGCYTVLAVHDEYVIEVPEDRDDNEVSDRLHEVMTTTCNDWLNHVNIGADVHVRDRYMKC